MAALTLRLVKGSALTNAELDANFTALNTELGQKLVSSDLTPYLQSATAASTYQTISGMSSYLTTANAASTYLPFAGVTLTGGLTFSGSNLLIAADLTSSTRLRVQTSTANGNTIFGLLPSGTAVNAQFQAQNSSDPNNASIAALVASSSQVRIVSGYIGTGTLNPITFIFANTEAARITPNNLNFLIGTSVDNGTDKLQVNGSVSATSFSGSGANLTGLTFNQITTALGYTPLSLSGGALTGNLSFDGTGLRITGDFTSSARVFVQTSTANSNTFFGLLPNGTATNTQFQVFGSSNTSDSSYGTLTINASAVQIQSAATGTGSVLPFRIMMSTSEALRVATTGNVLIGTTADTITDKLQVNGSVSATFFNGSGANLTGLTSGQITTALGFTPYNATNPSGYVNQEGVRSAISATGSISYNSSTGVLSYTTPTTDGVNEGATNLYFTNARARSAISVTQNLNYDSSTGVITGPNLSGYLTSATAASTYQPILVSGTNIKTINGNSVLGSGNLNISGGAATYSGQYVASGTTTNGDETEIFVNGNAGSRITLTDSRVSAYVVQIAARRTNGSPEPAFFDLYGVAYRSGASASDQGNLYENVIYRFDINMVVDVRVNTADQTLRIYVTGVSGKTISWTAVVNIIES